MVSLYTDIGFLDTRAAIIPYPLIVSPDTTVINAIAQMSGTPLPDAAQPRDPQERNTVLEGQHSCILVVEHEQLAGILTEANIVRLNVCQQPLDQLLMRQVMLKPSLAFQESALPPLSFLPQLLQQHRIQHLPILDERDYPIGLITPVSLLQALGLTATLPKDRHFIEQINESSTAILYIFDLLKHRIIYINHQICNVLGYTPEEIQEMGDNLFSNLVHPDDLPLILLRLEQYRDFEQDEISNIEYRIRHMNGEWRWLQSCHRIFKRTPEGSPCQIIGTAADITARKQAEAQLQELNQQLEAKVQERTAKLQQTNAALARATRLKDEFLANMSHELRTPLNAILGMAEGLQEQIFGEVNAEQHKALQTISRSGTYLLELINDILDLAKIESEQIEIECRPTIVSSLCRSSLAFVKQQAFQKNIRLETKLLPDLPNLLVDERRIRQVLINLLSNAVKFTPEGGHIILEVSHSQRLTPEHTFVEGKTEKPKDFIHITVTDTGIGIAPEHQKNLFQPFFQIDSALNRKYTGTGLGLALVKRLVELNGGQVAVKSEVGVGSCFMIDLPCTLAKPSPASTPLASIHSKPRSSSQKPSPLILLAEDNAENIYTLSSYLRVKGYRLVTANSGKEALLLARSENPDLILMDVQMPEMDGLEAMRVIRQDPTLTNIPIIALTGLAMSGDRDRCLAAGANDYLSKPVNLKQLHAIIQNLLIAQEEQQ